MTPHSLSDQARVSYEARLRADGPTPALIRAAEPCVAALDDCRVTARRDELRPVEYAVASGVLNVKQQASDAEWSSYVRDTIADLAALGTRGFVFIRGHESRGYRLESDVSSRCRNLAQTPPSDTCGVRGETQKQLVFDLQRIVAVESIARTRFSISPSTGPASGGTSVTLYGTGFRQDATVTFGGTPATGVRLADGATLTVTLPAHDSGRVPILITNPTGAQAVFGFTYEP